VDEKTLNPRQSFILLLRHLQPCATDYELIELDIKIVDLCHDLLDRYPVRAYDAVQLASAMLVNPVLQSAELSPLVFVSADIRLNAIAEAEGLTVDNPNFHQ